jgi:putative transposase
VDQTQQKTECSCIPTVINKFTAKEYLLRNRVLQRAFERLELLDAKVSRAVLRGRDGGNTTLLPDTLATGYTDQGRFYHIGGFKGYRYYNKQLDKLRSKRDKCKKKSRRYIHLSRVYKRVAEKKRRKQQDCLHKASHLITGTLAERAVVIGDLSQRQMVIKKQEHETPKERRKRQIRNRLVYNNWGLSGFVQMLEYKCLRFGKELHSISERDTTKMCHVCKHKKNMPLWQRTYRCENCGLVMDRDENSAVNIYERFLARPGPHTGDPVRCADVFTAIDDVNTCEHI